MFVSDAPFANADLSSLINDTNIAQSFHAGALSGSSVNIPIAAQGQYVRVQLSGSNPLSLAEVEVMGSVATNGGGSETQTEPESIDILAGLHYYINDHLYTPQQLVDSNNQVSWDATYEAFGSVEIGTQTVVNIHRFPGQYYDAERGLYYNWNRYYDAGVGRYVTSAPIGLYGGLNTFGYVYGNPLGFVDFEGLNVRVCFFPEAAMGFGHLGLGIGEAGDGGGTKGFTRADGGNPFNTPGAIKPDEGKRQCKILEADEDEDDCIKTCIKNREDNPGQYKLLSNQCTSFVRDCLETCGVFEGDFSGPRPKPFFNQLLSN